MSNESEPLRDLGTRAALLPPARVAAAVAGAASRASAGAAEASLVVVRSAEHPKSGAEHWAALVESLVRPGDVLGSLGPSELVVILEGASRAVAADIALLIVTHDLDDPPLLCGVATFPEAAATADAWLGAARAAAAATRLDAPVQLAPPA